MQTKHIVFGGRGRGKMMAAEEWLETLPKEIQDKVIVVKASDPVPERKGNKLPRIVDYDMMETSMFTWEIFEEIHAKIKSEYETRSSRESNQDI